MKQTSASSSVSSRGRLIGKLLLERGFGSDTAGGGLAAFLPLFLGALRFVGSADIILLQGVLSRDLFSAGG